MNPKPWIVSLLLAGALSVTAGDAQAQSNDCGKATVFYANGAISYSQEDAIPNINALRTALAARLSQLSPAERQQIPPYDIALAWVPSATNTSQTNLLQALYDNVRAAIGLPSYADGLASTHLTNYYLPALNAGRRVVTVSHSYGNLVTNQVASRLAASGFSDSIGILAVASVTTPAPITNFDYVTFTTDKAIQALADLSVGPSIPNISPANAAALSDPANHTFLGAYMQDAGAEIRIVDTILRQLKATKAPARCTPTPPPPANPIVVFDNLGDRQFCTTTATSVSCSGEPIGFIPGFGTIIPPQLQVKAAISFLAPSSCPCDVTSFELPIYLSAGDNNFFVTFRRDAGGLPDVTTPGGVGGFAFPGFMPTVASFAANPVFSTTTHNVAPTLISIQPNVRYWMEVSATDTTRAVWPFGRTGGTALVATTRSGNPYASLGDAAPAVRIVVTPR